MSRSARGKGVASTADDGVHIDSGSSMDNMMEQAVQKVSEVMREEFKMILELNSRVDHVEALNRVCSGGQSGGHSC
jgi:hypothetical protein